MASEDDSCFYNDDDDFYSRESDDDAALEEAEAADNSDSLREGYTVLNEKDIHQRIDDKINELSSVLSVSKADATTLLLHFQWSISKVHDAWFADDKSTREKAGLIEKHVIDDLSKNDGDVTCSICFETYSGRNFASAKCGHPFCEECWRSYIGTKISDGPGCLFMRCPDPSCPASVGRDLIESLTIKKNKERYSDYLVMSYIEHNKHIKWCPAPGCDNAIALDGGCRDFDVSCQCSHYFCWNCAEEAHRPLGCNSVAKWMEKNSSESENVNYILAFTKPCPKCKKPIEKNQGCNHMTCRAPCRHQFCWICLEDWRSHNYSCNKYRDSREKERENAQKNIKRFIHHFERWANNQKAMKKAIGELRRAAGEQVDELAKTQGQSATQIQFLAVAWQQIVECRKVLTWTYVYGYYMPEEKSAKRQLFEYLQGEAETGLERLHSCAEMEMKDFLQTEKQMEFVEFRKKLVDLTTVTGNYFANLVTALENGLAEVESKGYSMSKKRKCGK